MWKDVVAALISALVFLIPTAAGLLAMWLQLRKAILTSRLAEVEAARRDAEQADELKKIVKSVDGHQTVMKEEIQGLRQIIRAKDAGVPEQKVEQMKDKLEAKLEVLPIILEQKAKLEELAKSSPPPPATEPKKEDTKS